MLAFGHPGLTLGSAAAITAALRYRYCSETAASSASNVSWVTLLGRYVGIRLLLIGSLLPDIIDKPVGQLFFRDTFSEGRIFSHTLVFLIVLSASGFYLYRRRGKSWLLVLAFGTFTHLIFDEMWLTPRTLFWPVFGVAFQREDLSNWASNILQALFTNPRVYVPEVVGAVILLWFGVALIRRRKLFAFIRHGTVE